MWLKDKSYCPYCKQSARGDCDSGAMSINTNNDEHFIELELDRMVVPDEIVNALIGDDEVMRMTH